MSLGLMVFLPVTNYLKWKIELICEISMTTLIEGTHWVSLLIDRNTVVSFNCFGIENIPQEG